MARRAPTTPFAICLPPVETVSRGRGKNTKKNKKKPSDRDTHTPTLWVGPSVSGIAIN